MTKTQELSVTIKWSADLEIDPMTYTFETAHEQAGFMRGVEEASGWLEYELLKINGANPTEVVA